MEDKPTPPAASGASVSKQAAGGKDAATRILLYDPVRTNARITRMVLNQAGYHDILYCSTTKECIEEHSREPIQIVLLDFPNESGPHFKLARFLRKQTEKRDAGATRTQSLHIVAIITIASKPLIKAAIMAGASAIWVKPLAPASVQKRMAAIEALLAEHGGQHQSDNQALMDKLDKI